MQRNFYFNHASNLQHNIYIHIFFYIMHVYDVHTHTYLYISMNEWKENAVILKKKSTTALCVWGGHSDVTVAEIVFINKKW